MAGAGQRLDEILQQVQSGELSLEEAKRLIRSFDDIGFARVDTDRARRMGFPEVIFAEGKTQQQVVTIIERLRRSESRILATRVNPTTAEAVVSRWPDMRYSPGARTIAWVRDGEPRLRYTGYVAIVSGGTSDIPVADEAAVTAETMGAEAKRFYDVGVAGIHRLLASIDEIRSAAATVVVAGMEGALGSVVAGLVACPVIAVPTSVGYGASFSGLAPLLTMLNSCAPGISVVNIDNGFGAGYFAATLCRQITEVSMEGGPHAR